MVLLLCSDGTLAAGLTHELQIALQPALGHLIVTDRIGFNEAKRVFNFRLNAGLSVSAQNGTLEKLGTDSRQSLYRVSFDAPVRKLRLHYEGTPVFGPDRGHGGMPQGELSDDGVYLDGASTWYPLSNDLIAGVTLRVTEPASWRVLSVGRRSEGQGEVVWHSERPQDDVYLLAGHYTRHAMRHAAIDLSVWLLHDDPGLAGRYLPLMAEYIDHYSKLIGTYPYAKFAVVENRWPTGLGMPSFTLLGSQVLRLPFIPYTSLPHEILHNWWGNGVWVDYRKGNWSEGLTAYLADHWMKEREGKGAEYRLRALQRYSNYAAGGVGDMPLLDFVSRHDEASQSVGYSKSLMYFHMLRRSLGDEDFEAGLRRLWQQHRFQRIGFETAVRSIIGDHSGIERRLLPWLKRKGAPRLELVNAEVQLEGDGYRLRVTLGQDSDFDVDVPVRISFADGSSQLVQQHLDGPRVTLDRLLDKRPVRIQVDPNYDVLRYLDPSEQPPVLSQLFGGDTWLVIPTQASVDERAAWRALAQAWQRRFPGLRIMTDQDRYRFRGKANLLVLGWDNRMLDDNMRAMLSAGTRRLTRDTLQAGDRDYPADGYAVALVGTDAHGVSTGFIGARGAGMIDALARKLPHYGAYGVLVFDAADATNLYKAVPENLYSRLIRAF